MVKVSEGEKELKKGEEKRLKSSLDFEHSFTDRIAIFIADTLGSMTFLLLCVLLFITWISWNLDFLPGVKPFDPFPFPVLEMAVSLFAIILSVAVLINQNRQGKKDKIQHQVEFEVNVQAEHEVTKILTLLHEIHQHLGLDSREDAELEQMKETTDIKQIHQKLDDQVEVDRPSE